MKTPRIKRRLLFIRESQEKTRRGNPRHYWLILECGHVDMVQHGPSVSIKEFILEADPTIVQKVRCRDCERGSPVNAELLSHVTPWEMWRDNNFDRFLPPKDPPADGESEEKGVRTNG